MSNKIIIIIISNNNNISIIIIINMNRHHIINISNSITGVVILYKGQLVH